MSKNQTDKLFFKSLKYWVKELEIIKFRSCITKNQKIEIIISLINKFIFLQTLADYSVIEVQWILNSWQNTQKVWKNHPKKKILEKFLKKINKMVFTYYEPGCFKEFAIEDFVNTKKNFENLHSKLELILGFKPQQNISSGSERGITNFNFRNIDEDIFGKAYETYLAEIRDEQGIYYTPKEITNYIVQETIGKFFEKKIKKLKKTIREQNFRELNNLLEDILSFKVLDPACGSGSFLIKAVRLIWSYYKSMISIFKDIKHQKIEGIESSKNPQSLISEEKKILLAKIQEKLNLSNKMDLISKLVLRHIHGNDLDIKALDVCKLNIWLEIIKLIPEVFKLNTIKNLEPKILPNLDINLRHGDSLVGLPISRSHRFLKENFEKEIKELDELRKNYLEDPRSAGKIEKINMIIQKLNNQARVQFNEYLRGHNFHEEILSSTVPFHWGIEFWYVFNSLNDGFDIVIGNPPYLSADKMSEKLKDTYITYLKQTYQEVILEGSKPDMYLFFLEKAFNLSKLDFSFIIPNRIISNDATRKFRKYILQNKFLRQLINFSQSLQIFEEPNVHPCLIFLSKKHNKGTYDSKNVEKTSALMGDNFERIEYKYCKAYNILFDQKKKVDIIQKINHFKNLSGLIHEGLRGKKISKDEFKNVSFKEDYLPEYRGKNIRKYRITNFKGYFYYPKREREKDIKDFEEKGNLSNKLMQLYPKLVLPELSKKTRVSLDNKGWIAYGGIYFISEKECDIPLLKLTFLLNSIMFNYLYRFFYESGSWGQSLKFRSNYLERIKVPDNLEDLSFDETLPIRLRKIRDYIRKTYAKVKEDLKDNLTTLEEILHKERVLKLNNETENFWLDELSFYPENDLDRYQRKGVQFNYSANLSKKSIMIFEEVGIKKEQIFAMKFKDYDIMQLIYISLKELFNSRKKVKCLSDIFSKAEIPIVKTPYKKITKKLIIKCEKKIRNWLGVEYPKLTDYYNIIKVDNKINYLDNKIEAYIFKQYNLSKEDVKTVLKSFGVGKIRQKAILREFKIF